MTIKFNCSNPLCRRRLAVEEAMAGQAVQCPACATPLTVPASANLKFNCSNAGCAQHLVVDVAEAGRFVKCPACGKILQVPGAPQRPSFPFQPAHSSAKPAAPARPKRIQRIISLPPVRRLLLGWSLGLALLLGLHFGLQTRLPGNLEHLAIRIFFHDLQGGLQPNRDGTVIFYAQADGRSLNIYQLNPKTRERSQIASVPGHLGRRDFTWLGWSPDGREIAYAIIQPNRRAEVVVLRDRLRNFSRRTFDISPLGQIDKGAWINTNSLVLFSYTEQYAVLNFTTWNPWGSLGRPGLVPLTGLAGGKLHWLAADSDHSFAFINGRNLAAFDFLTGKSTRLAELNKGNLSGLAYDPASAQYIFSVQATNRKDFYVYACGSPGPKQIPPHRLSDDPATNALWLQQGTGFVSISAGGLTIHPADPAQQTNLFAGGDVKSCQTSPAGDKLYAVAAERHKLTGFWVYDLDRRLLQNLNPRVDDGFTYVEPVEAATTNESGAPVEFYYVPPPHPVPGKKYPVLLDQNLANRYEQSVQFLANAGILYVSASHFGITDWQAAPLFENTLAVYDALLKNPLVDTNRIYIAGTSKSTLVACELINFRPEKWRGAILFSPACLPGLPASRKPFPSLFISVGDQDVTGFRNLSEQLVLDASRDLRPVRLDYEPAPHIFPAPELMRAYLAAAKFILTDY